jgi:hypothetical protein
MRVAIEERVIAGTTASYVNVSNPQISNPSTSMGVLFHEDDIRPEWIEHLKAEIHHLREQFRESAMNHQQGSRRIVPTVVDHVGCAICPSSSRRQGYHCQTCSQFMCTRCFPGMQSRVGTVLLSVL